MAPFTTHTKKYKLASTQNLANNFRVFAENVIPMASLKEHDHYHGYNLCSKGLLICHLH